MAIVLPFPSKTEVVNKTCLDSDMGYYILSNFIEPNGLTKDNLVISHVLRCSLPYKKGKALYPTGLIKKNAEKSCRVFDDKHGVKGILKEKGLISFDPNLFILTFNPQDIFKVNAYYRQIQEDIAKACRFVKKGFRPVICMGNEAAKLVCPWIEGNGGVKAVRGHFGELEGWKFKSLDSESVFKTI